MLSETHGAWWLPGSDQRLPGRVTSLENGEIELSVVGSLVSQPGLDVPYPIVHGQLPDGSEVTLLGGRRVGVRHKGLSAGEGNETQETSRFTYGLIGIHAGTDEPVFDSVLMRFNDLEEWALIRPIEYRDDSDFESFTSTGESHIEAHRFEIPKPIVVELPEGTLEIHYGWQHSVGSSSSWTVERPVSFQWIGSKPKGLAELHERVFRPLALFLTFCMDAPAHLIECSLGMSGSAWETAKGIRLESSMTRSPSIQVPDLRQWDMLLTLGSIEDRFSDVINWWFTEYNNLKSVFDLMTAGQFGHLRLLEPYFLSIAQAAELLHRRAFSHQHELSKTDQRHRKEDILEHVPEPHREWLKEKLAFSNEVSLHQRLKELVWEVHYPARWVNWQELPIAVRDTRNYLTHYDEKARKRAYEGADLYWLAQELSVVLQANILKMMGLSDEAASDALTDTPRVRSVRYGSTVPAAARSRGLDRRSLHQKGLLEYDDIPSRSDAQ